ncbi:MAG: peptidylprolyl isomerase [Endomicrobium sp.]|nr:peptidylprolyl isomerase [Endomicrobium sp.]
MKKIFYTLIFVSFVFLSCAAQQTENKRHLQNETQALKQETQAETQLRGAPKPPKQESELAKAKAVETQKPKPASKPKEKKEMNATIETNLGTIKIKLLPENAPITVANFTELAKGTKEWTDPKTGKKVKKKFYDGLIFHRVIPQFMIQGGCPIGKGTGGPGYKFQDEIDPNLKFDRAGILAMANSGPNTNGSQFFITEIPTPWLNGNHTIFGYVSEGLDIVKKIARQEVDFSDKPVNDVVIKQIIIEE